MNVSIDFGSIEKYIIDVEKELGAGNGKAKRNKAIQLINPLIDIPWLPEPVEGFLIGLLVDLTIYLYNRWWGKSWISDIPAGEVYHA